VDNQRIFAKLRKIDLYLLTSAKISMIFLQDSAGIHFVMHVVQPVTYQTEGEKYMGRGAAMKELIVLAFLVTWLAVDVRAGLALNIALVPQSQLSSPDSPVNVTVFLTDFRPQTIGAFSFDVAFDPTVVSLTDVLFFSQLGDIAAGDAISFHDSTVGGGLATVSVGEVSLLDASALAALHRTSQLRLATLLFTTSGRDAARTALDLHNAVLSDEKGNPLTPTLVGDAEIVIPEPSTLVFFSTGLLGLVLLRRKSHTGQPKSETIRAMTSGV